MRKCKFNKNFNKQELLFPRKHNVPIFMQIQYMKEKEAIEDIQHKLSVNKKIID